MLAGSALLLGVLAGCGGDDPVDPAESFECTTERDGWEQCDGGDVQWCHIDHFHSGARCSSLGYACVELSESEASCLDEASTCTVGEFKCEDNTAFTCIDHNGAGHFAIEPCGTAKLCHEGANDAHCEERATQECRGHGVLENGACTCNDGYRQDPEDDAACVVNPAGMCTIFSGTAEPHTLVTDFADFPNAHAELNEPIEAELPAGSASYIHFPVTQDAEYVVFTSGTDLVDAVMHRDGTEIASLHAAGPNGMCAQDIPEHFHVELQMDADSGPVPYIVRFKAQDTATTIRFMLIRK